MGKKTEPEIEIIDRQEDEDGYSFTFTMTFPEPAQEA